MAGSARCAFVREPRDAASVEHDSIELHSVHFAAGAVLLGAGTAMVYPTPLAAIGDVAHPPWRASAVGVYRLWRDSGYAVGAIVAGFLADALGISAASLVSLRGKHSL